ncbi:MAG: DUF4476 domain-containing protein [Bacteroidota bacterium]
MKKLLSFFVAVLVFTNCFSQNCVVAVSSDIVSIQYNKTALLTNDQLKLNSLNSWVRGKCLLSSDVMQLAVLFSDDAVRLQFCETVYPNIFDKQNYYSVFDAFNSLSYAFRFHDFVNGIIIEYNESPPSPIPVKIFPDLNYPSPVGYKGLAGCQLPMSDNDFNVLVKPVTDAQGDVNRGNSATEFMKSNCVSMAQLMKLATLIQLDLNRQKFMKQNFAKCFDMQNYTYAAQVFSTQSYKDDWNAFADATIKSMMTPVPPPVPVCFVSQEDMNSITASISKLSFSDTKMSTAKQIIQSKKCFTVTQLKSIVNLLSYDGDKLDLAKFAYDYCIDQPNYYQMTDVFSFDSSQNDLLEFLKTKK